MRDRLYSEVKGTGHTIVLLHGLLSSTHSWDAITEKLTANHKTVAIDLLGFGQSPKPAIAYTIDDHLSALEHAIESQDQPYTLVGHSVGAIAAIAYANRHPARIKKLLLINPPLFTSAQEARSQIKRFAKLWYFFSYGILGYVAHAFEQFVRLLLPVIIVVVPVDKRVAFRDVFRHTWRSYTGTMNHLILSDYGYISAQEVVVPTVILIGEQDPFTMLNHTKKVASGNKNITYKVFPATHHFILDNTEVLLKEIGL